MALLVDPADFGGRIDQSVVTSALARSRIANFRMPGSLLDEAYSSPNSDSHKHITGLDSGKRYFQQGTAPWQRMN